MGTLNLSTCLEPFVLANLEGRSSEARLLSGAGRLLGGLILLVKTIFVASGFCMGEAAGMGTIGFATTIADARVAAELLGILSLIADCAGLGPSGGT